MIKINEKFIPLYEERTRYYIITGERGSSKSFSVSDYLLRKTFQKKQIIYFTRFTLDSAKDSVIPEFNEKIELLNADSFFTINKLDVINRASKSVLKFRGVKASQGSQTAKLKGLTGATVWVIDEAEEFIDEELFDKLDASLRVKGQKNIVIFIMNPTYRTHFIYKRFFRDAGVPENSNTIKNNVSYIHLTWEDNRENLDEGWINDAEELRISNPKLYKKKFTTGWLAPEGGLAFPEFITKKNIQPDENNTRIAYIDTADEGTDFYSMPICEIVNDKIILIDVLFSQQNFSYTQPKTVELIEKWKIDTVVVETNKEGSLYISNLSEKTKATIIGVRSPSNTSKHARIIAQSDWITEHLIIKEPKDREEDYNTFIEQCFDYRKELSKNKGLHDDAPDSLAGIAKYCRITFGL